jgi:hypothetical protein
VSIKEQQLAVLGPDKRGSICAEPLCRSKAVAGATKHELSGVGLFPKGPQSINRCKTCGCFFTTTGVIVKHARRDRQDET